MSCAARRLLCGLFLTFVAVSTARADVVLLGDGGTIFGTVRVGETRGSLVLERPGQPRLPLKLSEIVGIDWGREIEPEPIRVVLHSGERLAGTTALALPDRVVVTRAAGVVTLPLALCETVLLTGNQSVAELRSVPEGRAGSATVILTNGDRITGTFQTIRDGKQKATRELLLRTAVGQLPIDVRRIAALRLPRSGDHDGETGPSAIERRGEEPVRVHLELTSGEQIAGTVVEGSRSDAPSRFGGGTGQAASEGAGVTPPVSDAGPGTRDTGVGAQRRKTSTVQSAPIRRYAALRAFADDTLPLKTAWGATLSVPLDTIARLLVQNGRFRFLSDMRPVEARHTPYLDTPRPHRVNESQAGRPLQLGPARFSRGLGVHPYSDLTYELAGAYHTFAAVIGVDAAVGSAGSVVFRVLGDDRVLFESPVLHGGEEPLPIRVDVRGVLLLRLVVDFADNGDFGDHANWANAHLLR